MHNIGRVAKVMGGDTQINIFLELHEQMNGPAINMLVELEKFMKHMEYLNVEYMDDNCYGNFISTMWNDLVQKDANINVIEAKEMIDEELGLDNNVNTLWILIATRVVHD